MKTFDLILILFFISLLGVSLAILINVKSEEAKCIANPLQFGITQLEDYLKVAGASCICSLNNKKYIPIIVTRNKTEPIDPIFQSSEISEIENISWGDVFS